MAALNANELDAFRAGEPFPAVDHASTGEFDYLRAEEPPPVIGGATVYTDAPAAGIVLGGTGLGSKVYTSAPAAGIVLNGTRTVTKSYSSSPASGIVLGGTRTLSMSFTTTRTGGVVLGGTGLGSKVYTSSRSGGIVLGGTGAGTPQFDYAPSAGIRLNGTASTQWHLNVWDMDFYRRGEPMLMIAGKADPSNMDHYRALEPPKALVWPQAHAPSTITCTPAGGIVFGGVVSTVVTAAPGGGLVLNGTGNSALIYSTEGVGGFPGNAATVDGNIGGDRWQLLYRPASSTGVRKIDTVTAGHQIGLDSGLAARSDYGALLPTVTTVTLSTTGWSGNSGALPAGTTNPTAEPDGYWLLQNIRILGRIDIVGAEAVLSSHLTTVTSTPSTVLLQGGGSAGLFDPTIDNGRVVIDGREATFTGYQLSPHALLGVEKNGGADFSCRRGGRCRQQKLKARLRNVELVYPIAETRDHVHREATLASEFTVPTRVTGRLAVAIAAGSKPTELTLNAALDPGWGSSGQVLVGVDVVTYTAVDTANRKLIVNPASWPVAGATYQSKITSGGWIVSKFQNLSVQVNEDISAWPTSGSFDLCGAGEYHYSGVNAGTKTFTGVSCYSAPAIPGKKISAGAPIFSLVPIAAVDAKTSGSLCSIRIVGATADIENFLMRYPDASITSTAAVEHRGIDSEISKFMMQYALNDGVRTTPSSYNARMSNGYTQMHPGAKGTRGLNHEDFFQATSGYGIPGQAAIEDVLSVGWVSNTGIAYWNAGGELSNVDRQAYALVAKNCMSSNYSKCIQIASADSSGGIAVVMDQATKNAGSNIGIQYTTAPTNIGSVSPGASSITLTAAGSALTPSVAVNALPSSQTLTDGGNLTITPAAQSQAPVTGSGSRVGTLAILEGASWAVFDYESVSPPQLDGTFIIQNIYLLSSGGSLNFTAAASLVKSTTFFNIDTIDKGDGTKIALYVAYTGKTGTTLTGVFGVTDTIPAGTPISRSIDVVDVGNTTDEGFLQPPLTSGGITLDGDVAVGEVDLPSGGIRLGGTVALSRSYTSTSTGGVRLAGVATDTRTVGYAPAGGVVLGGQAASEIHSDIFGGIILGGTASVLLAEGADVTGGIVLGGTAAVSETLLRVGGIVLGGTVTIGPGFTIPTTGGILLGGVQILVTFYDDSPTGGIILGGVVPEVLQPTRAGRILRPTTGMILRRTGAIA